MRIAIPVGHEELCMYFGRCNRFSIIDIDLRSKHITRKKVIDLSENQQTDVPKYLEKINVNMVIANSICHSTRQKLSEKKICILYGAQTKKPETLVTEYAYGNLYARNHYLK